MAINFRDRFGKIKSWASELAAAVRIYDGDRLASIPASVLSVMHRAQRPRFAILGTKDFGEAFAAYISGRYELECVVDDFKSHKGKTFCGAEIISSDRFVSLAKANDALIAVNSCRFDYSRRYFEDLCRQHEIPVMNFEQAVRLLDLNPVVDHRHVDWAPAISRNLEDYLRLSERFGDSYSADTYFSVLMFHMSCDPEWHQNISKPYSSLYFRSGLFALNENESLVDCGASIGESTAAFIDAAKGRIKRSWMIEPDKFNVDTLKDFIRKHKAGPLHEKMSLHPVAVGNERCDVDFNHVGWHGGSIVAAGKGNGKVRVERLDDLVDAPPSIIKMDIEGAELDALRGAAGLIGKYRPRLLVSAYHRNGDLVQIPAFVQSITDDYRLGVRHHTEDRWDTCLYFY